MRIIGIIEDQEVIDKIRGHLGLCQKNQRPPPKPKTLELQIDYSDSQLSFYEEAFDLDFSASEDHPAVKGKWMQRESFVRNLKVYP